MQTMISEVSTRAMSKVLVTGPLTEWRRSHGMLLPISTEVVQVEATQVPMSVTKQQAKRTT